MSKDLIEEIEYDGRRPANQPGKRRRVGRLAIAGIAVAAVAGVAIAGSAAARTSKPAAANKPAANQAAAAKASTVAAPAVAAPKAVVKNGFAFQNSRPAVETVAAGQAAHFGEHVWYETKSSTWALFTKFPGEGQKAAYAWTGKDDSESGLVADGSKASGPVFASMFNGKVHTVVYTQGKKAWYGKVYRFAAIPGGTFAGIELAGEPYAPDPAGGLGRQKAADAAMHPGDISVYGYDQAGKLVSQFGNHDPLGGGLGKQLPGGYGVSSKVDPNSYKPEEHPLPADPIAACKSLLSNADKPKPGAGAKAVARIDGTPGSVLILADNKNWAGCDTAYARANTEGSLRQPAKIAVPAATDRDAFAVAENIVPVNGKQYEYYWAAGLLPKGVAKVSYTFPDGVTADSVVKGNYWVMQHQEAKAWHEGDDAARPQIKVTLAKANGAVVNSFRLSYGKQTCAQITHGC
jgi:hypothetical protein